MRNPTDVYEYKGHQFQRLHGRWFVVDPTGGRIEMTLPQRMVDQHADAPELTVVLKSLNSEGPSKTVSTHGGQWVHVEARSSNSESSMISRSTQTAGKVQPCDVPLPLPHDGVDWRPTQSERDDFIAECLEIRDAFDGPRNHRLDVRPSNTLDDTIRTAYRTDPGFRSSAEYIKVKPMAGGRLGVTLEPSKK